MNWVEQNHQKEVNVVKLQILIEGETWADVSESITLQEAARRQMTYQASFPTNVYRIVTV